MADVYPTNERPIRGRKGCIIAAAVLLLVCVLAAGAVSAANTVTVYDYAQLSGNISSSETDLTIIIAADIPVGANQGFSVSKNITLTTTVDANYTLYRTEANTTNGNGMFTVANGGNLTILGNNSHTLTLDGNTTALPGNGQTLVWINNGGNFTLDDGGVLTNNSVKGEGANGEKKRGGAVYVAGGTFTMEGGTISRNAAEDLGGGVNVNSGKFTMSGGVIGGEEEDSNSAFHGGGVCVYSGTFEMSGGTISGNNATGDVTSGKDGYGGGVMLYLDTASFSMSGGSISGNTANAYGGGVSLRSGGSFSMSNGDISGNEAYYGGGVYLTGSGTYTMSGGTISENTAAGNGGGVNLYNGASTFTMSGGTISENEANKDGGGVGVTNGQFTMSGGTISKNEANGNGDGVYVGGTFNVDTTGTADFVYLPQGKVITVIQQFTGSVSNIESAVKDVGTNIVDLTVIGGAVEDIQYFTLDTQTMTNLFLRYDESEKMLELTDQTFTVSFETDGGSPKPIDQTVSYGGKVTEPAAPTKTGYSFTGWYNGGAQWNFATDVVTSDMTLYAKWTPNEPGPTPPSGGGSSDGNMDNAYRVLFNDGATTLSVVTDLSAGDKLTKPEDPVKDGYTFAGWHKDTACTQPWDFNDGITGDMTLYAKWTPQETITPTATATATPTVTATATATQTAEPTGEASPAPTSQPDNNGNNGDTTNGETPAAAGISLSYLIGGILILLLAILLLLFLLLRHTVTFLIPTGGELEEYRIKVWHGRYINTEDLPDLIRTAAWYRDPARQERDRVKKSIELYLG